MSIRRFFSYYRITDHHISIFNEKYHHLNHVFKIQEGDSMEVFDGKGNFNKGIIKNIMEDEAIICM